MSRDVRFWEIRPNKSSKRKKTYEVRWKVGGRERSRTFETKALAKNFLLDLQMAAKRGEEFEIKSGLPESMIQAKEAVSWLGFVQAYIASRWPHAAAKTRDSMTDALATVTPVLVTDAAGMPEAETVRTALRLYALLPADRRPSAGSKRSRCPWLRWHRRQRCMRRWMPWRSRWTETRPLRRPTGVSGRCSTTSSSTRPNWRNFRRIRWTGSRVSGGGRKWSRR